MEPLARLGLLIAAAIHVVPVVGVLSAERLAMLYAIPIESPDLAILMRHRAVLFGIVAGLLIAGAFVRSLRAAAFVVGFTSIVPFLALAYSTGQYGPAIARIVLGDWIALLALVVAVMADAQNRARPIAP